MAYEELAKDIQKYLESIHGPIDWNKPVPPEMIEKLTQIFLEEQQRIREGREKEPLPPEEW